MTKQQQIKQLEQAIANTKEVLQRLEAKSELSIDDKRRYALLEDQHECLFLQLNGIKGEAA